MVLTGLFLWFRNETVDLLSREFVSVSRVIHLYEAWLASLAILVWHFYAVIFKPGVYPGNPSWVTGKMPAEMYEEEHPGEPVEEEAGSSSHYSGEVTASSNVRGEGMASSRVPEEGSGSSTAGAEGMRG